MNLLSRDELKTLIAKYKGPCISIFLPTPGRGADIHQNPVRLKHLLREAEERLLANGLRAPQVKGLLEPVHTLLGDRSFWEHPSDGLALLLSSGVFRSYHLPVACEERAVVSDRFYIKPLLPLLTGDTQFFVLALSQKEVRLLQCTPYSAREVRLPRAVPQSLADALKYDDPERQQRFHPGTPGGQGRRAAIFHGHGSATDDAKENILRYFHQINRGLQEILKKEQAPLVLAGVDYLFPIYREANTYPHLLEEGVAGNPEGLRAEELHRQAWAIVQPYFLQTQQEAVAQYRQWAGTGRTSRDVREIVPAAAEGRVALLFVAVGFQQWGTFDPETHAVSMHEKEEPGDEDLPDTAAVHTLLNGGVVYAVEPEKMPDNVPLAAVFRY